MAKIPIRKYDVEFPYDTPYDIQKRYMEKVLESLDNKQHAVLESPTGTGKTLCLFAPVAAWVRKKKIEAKAPSETIEQPSFDSIDGFGAANNSFWGRKRGKVWYTARTHSQLAQTVAEVRRCNIEGLQITVMGARDQLCINPDVLSEKDSYVKTVKCKELTKAKKCYYFNKINQDKENINYFPPGEVMDIEDLVALGKSCKRCPYFMTKRGSETSDIVLLPYNYIIDKDSREANNINLMNDVIIFDEGHNIPNTCEESFEFQITTADVVVGIRNVQELMLHLSKLAEMCPDEEAQELAVHANNSMFMMEIFKKLECEMNRLKKSDLLFDVSWLYQFFEKSGITHTSSSVLISAIEAFKADSMKLGLQGSILSTFYLLERMVHAIFGHTVKSFDQQTIDRSFKCGVSLDADHENQSMKLSLFCFNPSFGIQSLLELGVQSIIITSGTLSPLNTFIHELNLPSPVTLENKHIAKSCQVPFMILGTGVNNVSMDASFKNRSDPKYVFSLGMTLTNLIASVPDGVLLLFSSYSMMKNLIESWQNIGVWDRLNKLKRVFMEQRGKEDFINCLENYKRAIDAGNGAVLLGVLRGKISEGMDFKDHYCRAVFIVGVPFPPVMDPRVKGKERYSETLTVKNPSTNRLEKLYNNSFMSVEAMKATNQAVGRVIRHGKDYGAIILVDHRFSAPRLFSNISSWIRGKVPVVKNFPEAKKHLREFFQDVHLGQLDVPEIHVQPVNSQGCPIAGEASYEEYDHRRVVRTPAPNIAVNPPVSIERPPGASKVIYIDDDDSDKISSYFDNAKSKTEVSKPAAPAPRLSLLDALETSKGSSSGYREFDMFQEKSEEPDRNKRKYMNEGGEPGWASKSPCLVVNSSPSMLSGRREIEPSQRSKLRGLGQSMRFKLRTMEPNVSEEQENYNDPNPNMQLPDKSNLDLERRNKVHDYLQSLENSLVREERQEIRGITFKYMRKENSLEDVIVVLDKWLCSPNRKNLFRDFGVCVKTKDKLQWDEACLKRNIVVKGP